MANSAYFFPVEALPIDIRDAYKNLEQAVNEWINYPVTEQASNIFEIFEQALLILRTPEQQIRFLCAIITGVPNTDYPWAASLLHDGDSEARYMAWVSLRLIQSIANYVGNSRLRSARAVLESDWEAASQRLYLDLYYSPAPESAATRDILQFCFSVLIPFAREVVARRNSSPTREAGSVIKEAVSEIKSKRNTSGASEKKPNKSLKTVASLCINGFVPSELVALLDELGVVSPDTGLWHLGDLKGKAAAPLGAFPAAYRALVEAHLLLDVDAPVYRELFQAEYQVVFRSRMATYRDGHGSAAFQNYLAEARRWILNRRARQNNEK